MGSFCSRKILCICFFVYTFLLLSFAQDEKNDTEHSESPKVPKETEKNLKGPINNFSNINTAMINQIKKQMIDIMKQLKIIKERSDESTKFHDRASIATKKLDDIIQNVETVYRHLLEQTNLIKSKMNKTFAKLNDKVRHIETSKYTAVASELMDKINSLKDEVQNVRNNIIIDMKKEFYLKFSDVNNLFYEINAKMGQLFKNLEELFAKQIKNCKNDLEDEAKIIKQKTQNEINKLKDNIENVSEDIMKLTARMHKLQKDFDATITKNLKNMDEIKSNILMMFSVKTSEMLDDAQKILSNQMSVFQKSINDFNLDEMYVNNIIEESVATLQNGNIAGINLSLDFSNLSINKIQTAIIPALRKRGLNNIRTVYVYTKIPKYLEPTEETISKYYKLPTENVILEAVNSIDNKHNGEVIMLVEGPLIEFYNTISYELQTSTVSITGKTHIYVEKNKFGIELVKYLYNVVTLHDLKILVIYMGDFNLETVPTPINTLANFKIRIRAAEAFLRNYGADFPVGRKVAKKLKPEVKFIKNLIKHSDVMLPTTKDVIILAAHISPDLPTIPLSPFFKGLLGIIKVKYDRNGGKFHLHPNAIEAAVEKLMTCFTTESCIVSVTQKLVVPYFFGNATCKSFVTIEGNNDIEKFKENIAKNALIDKEETFFKKVASHVGNVILSSEEFTLKSRGTYITIVLCRHIKECE